MAEKWKALVGMTLHKDAAVRLSEEADIEAIPYEREALMNALRSADALITYSLPLDVDVLREACRLRVISCHACPEALCRQAKEQGIAVTLVPTLWDTVADLTLALMFAAARNIPQAHSAIQAGQWLDGVNLKTKYSGLDVFGRTMGIIGLGQIGSVVARRVQGFDTRVLYYDIERKPELEKQYHLEFRPLEALLAESDFIIVLVPLCDATRGMIGKKEISLMKRDAVLVNSARGAILDEAELVAALLERRIAAAGLDVFTDEPLRPGNPLLELDNVVLAPHLGGSTKQCDLVLVEDALRVLRGENATRGV